jgi:phage terminase large subunit
MAMLEKTKEQWPPPYKEKMLWRCQQLPKLRSDPLLLAQANAFYKNHPEGCYHFIRDWGVIHEPRDAFSPDASAVIPFLPFKRQREFIQFIISCLRDRERGLCEKSRTMGATWSCVWISIWLWRYFEGASIGWGSQDSDDVDQLGNPSSIFEKIRIGINNLPHIFLPEGFSPKNHMLFMRIINPANGASIVGGVGDNIGRGGRTLITFKDESCWYQHEEMIEAALSQNCEVQIDMSSVHGTNTLFHRRREAGVEWYPKAELPKGRTRVLVFDWHDNYVIAGPHKVIPGEPAPEHYKTGGFA